MRYRGIPAHKRGWLCKVYTNVKTMADRGLVPVMRGFGVDGILKAVLRTSEVPYEIGIGNYIAGRSPGYKPVVSQTIFVPPWLCEVWPLIQLEYTELDQALVTKVLNKMNRDVEFQKAVFLVLKLLDPHNELGAAGTLREVQFHVLTELLEDRHGR